ncbi:hypothetical protein PSTG_17970, partial [Puccinia striiformis f. sp. tritici PST-78]
MMEFKERAGHEMGVDSKHINRFVDYYLSGFMEEELHNEKFELQGLYKEHLEWVEFTKDIENKGVQVSALSEKINKNPEDWVKEEITLKKYLDNKLVGVNIFDENDLDEFLWWKLGKIWRSQYKDTEKLKILDLLEAYVSWARKDPNLKDNKYVKEWDKGIPKENETIMNLLE